MVGTWLGYVRAFLVICTLCGSAIYSSFGYGDLYPCVWCMILASAVTLHKYFIRYGLNVALNASAVFINLVPRL